MKGNNNQSQNLMYDNTSYVDGSQTINSSWNINFLYETFKFPGQKVWLHNAIKTFFLQVVTKSFQG